ncbi:hypothetical protein HID58_093344 [Brassica napus]|uniref:Pleckstrin-like plant domain-containing protein n=1 Tax=Brassica napus TaxID=3708 RepID=A0ABQ7XCZ9_BRANA|nr:hypothetical protein HID58_093344 [Brassica napus]
MSTEANCPFCHHWVLGLVPSPGKALPGEVDRCLTGPRGMIHKGRKKNFQSRGRHSPSVSRSPSRSDLSPSSEKSLYVFDDRCNSKMHLLVPSEGVFYGVYNEISSWPYIKDEENSEEDYFGPKTGQGLLEFKCKSKIQKHGLAGTVSAKSTLLKALFNKVVMHCFFPRKYQYELTSQ